MACPCGLRLEGADFEAGASFLVSTLSCKTNFVLDRDAGVPDLSLGDFWIVPEHPNKLSFNLRVIVWVFQSVEKW